MSDVTTFYIVRHGQSKGNLDIDEEISTLENGGKGTDLTEKGIAQAKEVAKRLKDIHFDLVFSSDLLRTKRTAEIIAMERQIEVTALAVLKEREFGAYGGNTQKLKDEMAPYLVKLSDIEKMRYRHKPDMETQEEAAARLLTFLRETALAYPGKTILITNHGTGMRSLLIHLGLAGYNELPSGAVPNAAYFVLQTDGVDFFLKETHGVLFHKD